jgi:hypothetical protein
VRSAVRKAALARNGNWRDVGARERTATTKLR